MAVMNLSMEKLAREERLFLGFYSKIRAPGRLVAEPNRLIPCAHPYGPLRLRVQPRRERLRNLLRRAWPVPIVALGDVATHRSQFMQFPGGLNTLGHHAETQRVREVDARRDDHAGLGIFVHPLDHRPVYLDGVYREALEGGDRGVAGPEVVHREPHPKVFERPQDLLGG